MAVPSGAAVHWMTLVFGGGGAWGVVINPNLHVIITMIYPDQNTWDPDDSLSRSSSLKRLVINPIHLLSLQGSLSS